MKATKILCTLGPATDAAGVIEAMAAAGMDAARLNFSHGGKDAQRARVEAVRAAEQRAGRPLAIVGDLQGPKIRVGRFPAGPTTLRDGDELTLAAGDAPCSAQALFVDYPELLPSLQPGSDVFLADGLLHLRTLSVAADGARCRVLRGGAISDHKGVNLPGVPLNMPPLTDKDRRDALDAAALGCDYIALSFVRAAADVQLLRDHVRAHGAELPIIVKLERPEAVERLEEIIAAADGVMVARGDLGVEVGVARVPILQKRILDLARRLGKPAIVATQMLESMTNSPLPTRAEASDVANAILDGADAVMLSGETAAGHWPVEAVRLMTAIAQQAEPLVGARLENDCPSCEPIAEAVISGAMAMAAELAPAAIVAWTRSGATARLIAKRRPRQPLVALSSELAIRRRCALYYGCAPAEAPAGASLDDLLAATDRLLPAHGLAAPGDRALVVAGWPLAGAGATNFIHLHEIGATSRA